MIARGLGRFVLSWGSLWNVAWFLAAGLVYLWVGWTLSGLLCVAAAVVCDALWFIRDESC
ncbi:MAG: hypothetical protein NVS9B15_25540 [Acidobacteriaceae bacterium]